MKSFTFTLAAMIFAFGTLVGAETRVRPTGFDLTKLRAVSEGKLRSTQEGMNQLLSYLREEIAHPSSPRLGIGGGPIDTIYVQSVIVGVMAGAVPPPMLLDAIQEKANGDLRTHLLLALVLAGDQTFVDEACALFENSENDLVRVLVARAARNFPKEKAVALLAGAQHDMYSRIADRDGEYVKIYPVRQAAHESLLQLKVPAPDWTLVVPLAAETRAAALASILEDGNSRQSASVLQAIGYISPAEARLIAQAFLEKHEGDPGFALPVAEAKKVLDANPAAGLDTVPRAE